MTAINPSTPLATSLLVVQDVSKRFGPLTALDHVSFDVRVGELFGLLGPNGAGKTTLLSILSGLLAADTGSVTLEGGPVSPDKTDIRRHIGLAPQEIALYPELSAAENLRFFGKLYGLAGADLESRIDEVLHAVGLIVRRGDRVVTFSGGMKRRLNLAAAVLHRPKILFLDEPTAGVDPQSRNHIFQEVRRLNAAGTTIVYTSHYMEEVQALCPRVGIIDAGRLVRCEPVSELLKLESTRVRFRTNSSKADLSKILQGIPAVLDARLDDGFVEIRTQSSQTTVPVLLRHLEEMGVAAEDLELEPPTLERVFLALTGHELRD
ncbi:MAG: ABC transporter ATP-binding protein [Gemmataceae bacterium]